MKKIILRYALIFGCVGFLNYINHWDTICYLFSMITGVTLSSICDD